MPHRTEQAESPRTRA